MTNQKYSVLFVCLGNICRSPLAEGVFRHLAGERGLEDHFTIDSCGTGSWHVGQPPHKDSQRVARENGVSLEGQTARQLSKGDFKKFDLLVAMDQENRSDIEEMRSSSGARVILLREFDENADSLDVPDPYYGGPEGFQEVFEIVHRSCAALLDDVEKELG